MKRPAAAKEPGQTVKLGKKDNKNDDVPESQVEQESTEENTLALAVPGQGKAVAESEPDKEEEKETEPDKGDKKQEEEKKPKKKDTQEQLPEDAEGRRQKEGKGKGEGKEETCRRNYFLGLLSQLICFPECRFPIHSATDILAVLEAS